MSSPSSATKPATINLTIETFHEIRTGLFCTIGQIAVASSGNPVYGNPVSPYPVRVGQPRSGASVDLAFNVTGSTPPPPSTAITYSVEAVYFSGSNSSAVFTNQQSQGGLVTIQDACSTTGHWNILIIVKRQVSVTDSNGNVTTWTSVGVIDPPIDNEPS